MYHIKKDKRQESSALHLIEGLTNCLKTKNMAEISVCDLCTASSVSRSTFYRMFETPVDVLEYACDTIITKVLSDYSQSSFKDDDDFVMFSILYWYNHSELLEALVNCNRLDIVQKSFETHSKRLIPIIRQGFNEAEMEYVRMGAAGLLSSLITVWIRRNKKENPSQIFDLYKKCVSLALSEGLGGILYAK